MNEFTKDQKALKTSSIFYFLFGGRYKEKYYLINKGINSLTEGKKRVSGAGVVIQCENICLTNLNLSSGPSTKRKEKERKGKKKKVS